MCEKPLQLHQTLKRFTLQLPALLVEQVHSAIPRAIRHKWAASRDLRVMDRLRLLVGWSQVSPLPPRPRDLLGRVTFRKREVTWTPKAFEVNVNNYVFFLDIFQYLLFISFNIIAIIYKFNIFNFTLYQHGACRYSFQG